MRHHENWDKRLEDYPIGIGAWAIGGGSWEFAWGTGRCRIYRYDPCGTWSRNQSDLYCVGHLGFEHPMCAVPAN